MPVIGKAEVLEWALDVDGGTVPDRVRFGNKVASVVLIDEISVPLSLDDPTVTVTTDEFVNRYVEVATDGLLDDDHPLIRDDVMFDKVPVETDEVVPAADSETVITMTVPFTVLVTPGPDAVVPVGLVITDDRVRCVPLVAEDVDDTIVVEADEADAVVDEVEFPDKVLEEVNRVEVSENGLVSVTPIVVNVTVRMVPFSVSWLDRSCPVDVLEGGSVELNHPVIVDTMVGPKEEEPVVELDIGRIVPDSPSVKDLVDSVDAVDAAVDRIVPFSVINVDVRLPVDVETVVVDAEADTDGEEPGVELDIGRMVPDSPSVKDLVDSVEVVEAIVE